MLRYFVKIVIILFFVTACSGGGGGSDSGSENKARLNFEILSTASETSAPGTATSTVAPFADAEGQVTASDLNSLKYYITDISICKEMTVNGTGYSGQSGCISVYSAEMLYDYDTFIAEDAALETENFVDLMSASDLSELSKTVYLTREDIGEYHYGKVDHYRPLKLTTSIRLSDDTLVYTKSGTSTLISGSGIDATYVTMVSDITTAPAEESIVVLPNGGSWFKFEKPFTLTADDVENETTFQMKLAFNPEGVIKAHNFTSDNQAIQDSTNNYGISVPLMPFTPVIYRTTQTAGKESYLFSYTAQNGATYNSFDFRLELYTVEQDSSDSIYAADTLKLLLREYGDSGSDVTQVFRPFSVTASNDTIPVYSFINWLNNDFITQFTRGTNPGDTSTATFHVDTENAITMDVLLKSIESIQADSTIDTISIADLAGRWTSACNPSGAGSQKEIYDFDGGGLSQTSISYTDDSCSTEKEQLVRNFRLKLIDKAKTPGGDTVKQINFIYDSATLTPKTTARADELNTDVYCNYDDWQIDVDKDVLGKDNCMGMNANDVIYDIYLVSETTLFSGDSPASTAENRPSSLGSTPTASYTGDMP